MTKKSGKLSCCGRGGSWFGDCGSAGDVNAGHTWYEGIRACQAGQFQTAAAQQLHFTKVNVNTASNNTSMGMETRATTMDVQKFESRSAEKSISTPVVMPASVYADASIVKLAYDTGTPTSNLMTTTVRHTSVNMLKPKLTILLVSPMTIPSLSPVIVDLITSASIHVL